MTKPTVVTKIEALIEHSVKLREQLMEKWLADTCFDEWSADLDAVLDALGEPRS